MRRPALILVLTCLLAASLVLVPHAEARSANVAALQVALKALHLYGGQIDGIRGSGTASAVRRFQRRRGLAVDGIAGPQTRRALGRRGRPRLGTRVLRSGRRGWDVAALQFLLRRRGADPGSIDGGYGPGTAGAVRRFQSRAGLGVDGVAGPATLRALRRSAPRRRRSTPTPTVGGPVLFFRPLSAPIGDGFGMRWGRMHQGLDFTAGMGARVGAAGRGVVSHAGWSVGGYGNLVIVDHRLGYQTWYAHLSRVTSYVGERVTGGTRLGLVGSTGHSTGPHLHFEVRRNGTPINPDAAAAGQRRHRAGVGDALAGPASGVRPGAAGCARTVPEGARPGAGLLSGAHCTCGAARRGRW